MNNAFRIDANIQWKLLKGESHRLVAVCDALNVSIDADTMQSLNENIRDSMQLMFQDMLLNNNLDKYLSKHGWQKYTIPKPTMEPAPYFDVPYELLMAKNGKSRHTH